MELGRQAVGNECRAQSWPSRNSSLIRAGRRSGSTDKNWEKSGEGSWRR